MEDFFVEWVLAYDEYFSSFSVSKPFMENDIRKEFLVWLYNISLFL